jgi:hypothetical protein
MFTFEDAEQAIKLMSSIMGIGANSAGSGKPIGFSKK